MTTPPPVIRVRGDDGTVLHIGGVDIADQQQIIAELQELGAIRGRRDELFDRIEQSAASIMSSAWDWLDQYSSLPVPGSPNAGQAWGPLLPAQKMEALRDGMSALFLWGIRDARAARVIRVLLERLIDATVVDPPASPI